MQKNSTSLRNYVVRTSIFAAICYNKEKNYYIVFLQEYEENDGKMEDDPINFHQAMQSSNSKNWIEAINEEYKPMQEYKV